MKHWDAGESPGGGNGVEPAAAGTAQARLTRSISALAGRYQLPAGAASQLGLMQDLLARDPAAPTTVREPSRVLQDHLADALVALELERMRAAVRIVDLGSGPGVPGLPLAIALSSARVVLVESNARKCEFIERAIELCGVVNASVVCARAEAWPDGLERCELVTARALAPLPTVVEYAAPLLAVGGALVVWRGRRDPVEETAGARAAAELGLEPSEPIHVQPYPGAIHRHLQVMVKTRATPARFPRRPGIARKRPLGGAGQ